LVLESVQHPRFSILAANSIPAFKNNPEIRQPCGMRQTNIFSFCPAFELGSKIIFKRSLKITPMASFVQSDVN